MNRRKRKSYQRLRGLVGSVIGSGLGRDHQPTPTNFAIAGEWIKAAMRNTNNNQPAQAQSIRYSQKGSIHSYNLSPRRCSQASNTANQQLLRNGPFGRLLFSNDRSSTGPNNDASFYHQSGFGFGQVKKAENGPIDSSTLFSPFPVQ
jgi:hypothetical protein